MSRAALSLIALLAALTVAGCTTTSSDTQKFQGTEGEVADAIGDLESAGKRRDDGKICTELLTRELARQMSAPGAPCEREISDAISDVDDFDLTVKDVSVSGQTATAQVQNDERRVTFRLQKVGANWRIASLGAR